MALQSATRAWQSVTLSSDEIWQAKVPVRLTADSTASTSMGGDNGVTLGPGEALQFSSGDTVFYMAQEASDAAIYREPRA